MAPNKLLNDVNLCNTETPLYFVSESAEEILDALREYEIENVVTYVTRQCDKMFNKGILPWNQVERRKNPSKVPNLRFSTSVVPHKYGPFYLIATATYNCRFGKHRTSEARNLPASERSTRTVKIGCQCSVEVQEIVRPLVTMNELNQKTKKAVSAHVQGAVRRIMNGESTNLLWSREFHMLISPLNEHCHLYGEAAGPHQKVDNKIAERIHDLAKAGITQVEVVRENIKHYVETVLFEGRKPPHPNNRRFYPDNKTYYNHVRLGMMASVSNESDNRQETTPDQDASTQEVPDFCSVEELQCEDDCQYQHQSLFHRNVEVKGQQVDDVGLDILIQAATSTEEPSVAVLPSISRVRDHRIHRSFKNKPIAGVTLEGQEVTLLPPRQTCKTAKERFQHLLDRLNKITDYIEEDEHYSELSAQLVNVVMKAREFLPEDKVDILYEKEYRQLKIPRRVRDIKYKPKQPQKRAPDFRDEQHDVIPVKKTKRQTGKHWSEVYGSSPIQTAASSHKANTSPINIVVGSTDSTLDLSSHLVTLLPTSNKSPTVTSATNVDAMSSASPAVKLLITSNSSVAATRKPPASVSTSQQHPGLQLTNNVVDGSLSITNMHPASMNSSTAAVADAAAVTKSSVQTSPQVTTTVLRSILPKYAQDPANEPAQVNSLAGHKIVSTSAPVQ